MPAYIPKHIPPSSCRQWRPRLQQIYDNKLPISFLFHYRTTGNLSGETSVSFVFSRTPMAVACRKDVPTVERALRFDLLVNQLLAGSFLKDEACSYGMPSSRVWGATECLSRK